MKILFKKTTSFLVIPLIIIIILIIGYFITDPFKVLYKYDSFSITEINLNRDYISTEILLNNYEKENYNSFIFGSSRAMGYNPLSWKKYLEEDANVFSYDAYSETLYGIYKKLVFLDTLQIPIDNVLLLIDNEAHFFLANEDNGSYLYKKHPVILGNGIWKKIDFQLNSLISYLNPKFCIPYYIYIITGLDNAFTKTIRSNNVIEINYPENWMNNPSLEKEIEENKEYFETDIFYERDKTTAQNKLINSDQQKILNEIMKILKKRNTNYKIIINPLYDQIKLNTSDLIILQEIFKTENIYDFSGINNFTNSKYNYYEEFHFRPLVGDSIMNIIFENRESFTNHQ